MRIPTVYIGYTINNSLFDKVVIPDTFNYVIHVVAPFNFVVPETDNDELHVILL